MLGRYPYQVTLKMLSRGETKQPRRVVFDLSIDPPIAFGLRDDWLSSRIALLPKPVCDPQDREMSRQGVTLSSTLHTYQQHPAPNTSPW